MREQQLLEGYSPDPTGTVHHVYINQDEAFEFYGLAQQLDQHQRWRNEDRVLELAEDIRSLGWFPRGWEPGDHLNIHIRPRVAALVRALRRT